MIAEMIMRTYRMLIVDDEPWILEGISQLIDWSIQRIEIVGALRDASAALRLLEENRGAQPDILLTDIRMPGIDGLSLIEEVRKRTPSIVSIILTGYSDFDYARRAIHCGVFEYLVKPVGREALIATISRLVEGLDKKQTNQTTSTARAITDHLSTTVKKAMAIIDENLYGDLSLSAVAGNLHINPTYLCKVFREETGENFKKYITSRKMREAKKLLEEEPFLKVYEICARLNYSDPDYFTRLFKKYIGVTPIQFKTGVTET